MIKRKHGARGSSWSKADVKNEIIGYSSELSSDYQETFFCWVLCHVFRVWLCSSVAVLSHDIHFSWTTKWFKYYSFFIVKFISTRFIIRQFFNKHFTLSCYYSAIRISSPFRSLYFKR